MKNTLKALLFTVISIQSFAQEDRKKVIKINLSAATLSAATIQYEKVLGNRFSVAVGVGFRPQFLLPFTSESSKYIELADKKIDYIKLDNVKKAESKIGLFHVTPELRYYFGKQQAPFGFYLSVFGKYNNFQGKVPVFIDTDYKNLPIRLELPVDTKLQTYSGGLMFGKQFRLGNRFTFDWYIAGGHFGRAKVHAESIQNLSTYDDAFRTKLRDRIISTFALNEDYLNLVVDANGVVIDNSLPLKYLNLRGFGFNLGYRF